MMQAIDDLREILKGYPSTRNIATTEDIADDLAAIGAQFPPGSAPFMFAVKASEGLEGEFTAVADVVDIFLDFQQLLLTFEEEQVLA